MVPPLASTASDAADLISAHIDSSEPHLPGAVTEKYGAGPSGYTCVNRHVTQPLPHTACSARSTASITPACRSGNADQVHAVSNVSAMTAMEMSASRPYGARRKLDR